MHVYLFKAIGAAKYLHISLARFDFSDLLLPSFFR